MPRRYNRPIGPKCSRRVYWHCIGPQRPPRVEPLVMIQRGNSLDAVLYPFPIGPHLAAAPGAAFDPNKPIVPPKAIIANVARQYGVTVEDLLSARREPRFVLPRHVAMWRLRRDGRRPFAQIGKIMGGRDHSTAMYGCHKVQALVDAGRLNPLAEAAE